ncbi:MAG: CPBP family intramembrane metalloprotease [Saprospiraceae bacterium]|nr:CPBP family intramembrane metalloprotease [Saprospiraceae bacterium]
MLNEYFPTPDHFDAALAVSITTLAFIAFWATVSSPTLVPRLSARYGAEEGQARKIYLQRGVGILGFGILPALVFWGWLGRSGEDFGWSARLSLLDLWWTLGLSALSLVLSWIGARKAESLAMYPEIRKPVWDRRTLLYSALSWVAYLVAYELIFRGFLLFSCYRAFGMGAAIAVNTAIYALVHVPKRLTEGIGAIILGSVLCVVTLQTGTIWVAVLVHVVLSLSNEWFSLRNHPDIRYVP